eukprot:gene999-10775_t
MESRHDLRRQQFEKLENKIATKDCISNLMKIIEDQNKKINMMEDEVMESHISQPQIVNDNLEQYQRRLCLRISGIDLDRSMPPNPHGMKEFADDCLDKVKHVFAELGVKVPEEVIDRAHRVGKVTNHNGKSGRQMIGMVYEKRASGRLKVRNSDNIKVIAGGRDMVQLHRLTHDRMKWAATAVYSEPSVKEYLPSFSEQCVDITKQVIVTGIKL